MTCADSLMCSFIVTIWVQASRFRLATGRRNGRLTVRGRIGNHQPEVALQQNMKGCLHFRADADGWGKNNGMRTSLPADSLLCCLQGTAEWYPWNGHPEAMIMIYCQ